jgi:hypothetical protein
MRIRIVKRPIGEAPNDVRDAWIGLSLPVVPQVSHIVEGRTTGVVSGPRNWFTRQLFKSLRRGHRMSGYMVDPKVAIDLLANHNPRAAAWWRTNASHLFKPGLNLLFDKECCEVELTSSPPAED